MAEGMKISVILEALTGSFDTDIDKTASKAEKRLQKMEKEFNVAFKNIALAAVAAGAAVLEFSRRQIEVEDRVGKLSKITGIAVETLSSYELAAKLANVSLDDLATGMSKLAKNAFEASKGSKAQVDAFAALGISVTDASGKLKTIDALLGDVADAFQATNDGTAKTALAQELLGKSGAALIPLLDDGRAGLKAVRKEAEELGLVFDDKTAKAAEAFNDNLTRLQAAADGFARELGNQLLPQLIEFEKQAIVLAKNGDLKEWAQNAAIGFARFAETVYLTIKVLNQFIEAVHTTLLGYKLLAEFITSGGPLGLAFKSNRDELGKSLDAFLKQAQDYGKGWKDVWTYNSTAMSDSIEFSINKARYGAAQLDEALKTAVTGIPDIPTPLLKQEPVANAPFLAGKGPEKFDIVGKHEETDADRAAAKAAREHADALEKLRKEIEETSGETDKFTEAQAKAVEQRALANELFAKGKISGQEYRDFLEAVSKNLDELGERAAKTADVMSEFWKEAAHNMQDAFANFLFDPFKEGLSGMLEGFADTLRRMVANAAAADLFKHLLGDSFGKEGGSLGGWAGAAKDWFTGLFKADGGDVFGNQPYIVGERGPELFVPRTAGNIVPNHALGGMRGGGGVTMNIFTPDANSFRASERQITRSARQRLAL